MKSECAQEIGGLVVSDPCRNRPARLTFMCTGDRHRSPGERGERGVEARRNSHRLFLARSSALVSRIHGTVPDARMLTTCPVAKQYEDALHLPSLPTICSPVFATCEGVQCGSAAFRCADAQGCGGRSMRCLEKHVWLN